MLTLTQSTNLTFTSSAQPTTNLSFYPTTYVGTDPEFQNCIGLIQLDLPPVQAVDSAVLQLSVIVKSGDDPTHVVVNRVLEPFDYSTVTYSTSPAYIPTSTQIDIKTSDLYSAVKFDITDLVNNMLNGTYENNGIALSVTDESVVQFATIIISYAPYYPVLTLTSSSPSQNIWRAGSEKQPEVREQNMEPAVEHTAEQITEQHLNQTAEQSFEQEPEQTTVQSDKTNFDQLFHRTEDQDIDLGVEEKTEQTVIQKNEPAMEQSTVQNKSAFVRWLRRIFLH